MNVSLNEIEAMAKRAARGAGLPFGLAEEAGKAARWLSAYGLPGAAMLAGCLTRNEHQSYVELGPASTNGIWKARGRHLSPLLAGAALCDRAKEIAGGRVIELGPTAQPLLLAPYAAGAAKLTATPFLLTWDHVAITMTPDGSALNGDRSALIVSTTARALCRRVDLGGDGDRPALISPNVDYAVDMVVWSKLIAFAQRTFAPASALSRLSGAGSGLNDNN